MKKLLDYELMSVPAKNGTCAGCIFYSVHYEQVENLLRTTCGMAHDSLGYDTQGELLCGGNKIVIYGHKITGELHPPQDLHSKDPT